MNRLQACPVCRAPLPGDAPDGLCPRCLITTLAGDGGGPTSVPASRVGDYELLGDIAAGGMGVVYYANQVSLNRNVALKMIRSGALATAAEVQRFRTEAEAAAQLDHPNIVPIYEVGEHEDRLYFSMKLVEGGSLAERISDFKYLKSQISNREAARLIATLASAVHHAHQRGVLHRDLKPTNILLDEQGQPHLTDFGLAKLVQSGGDLTQTIAILGTPNYMAPEQAAGNARELTTAADIYSLGAILYELLTGRTPFQGDSALEVLQAAQNREPVPPRKLNPSVDRDLEIICLQCLDKEPGRRFSSAKKLADDLEHWLAGEPIAARPVRTPERVLKWARRNPALATLIVLAHVLFLGGVIGVFLEWRRAEAETARAQINAQLAEGHAREAAEHAARIWAQEALTRQHLYAISISVARRAWEDGDMTRMNEVLESLQPAEGQEDLRGFEWHLLKRLASRTDGVLKHGAQARAVAFSPDGKLLVTGGSDVTPRPMDWARTSPLATTQQMQLMLSSAASGEPVRTLAGHGGWVNDATFSRDGRFLVSGGYDRRVRIWTVADGGLDGELEGHTDEIAAVAFSADGRWVATAGGQSRGGFGPDEFTRFAARSGVTNEVFIWDWATRKPVHRLSAHRNGVLSVAFSLDGNTLATAGMDGLVRLWDATSGSLRTQFSSRMGWLYSVVFSPDGKTLATVGTSAWVTIWDLESRQSRQLNVNELQLFAVGFSPDGQTLAVAGIERTIKLIDIATGGVKGILRGHSSPVWRLAFAPAAPLLASAGWDGTVRLWNIDELGEHVSPAERLDMVLHIDFTRDGRLFATSGIKEVKVWDARSLVCVATLTLPPGERDTVVRFAPGDSALAVAGSDGFLQTWDTRHWHEQFTVQATQKFWTVAWSPDARTLVTGSRGERGEITCWDAVTGERRHTFPALMDQVTSLAFSPDGLSLAAVGRVPNPNRLVLHWWDWETRGLVAEHKLSLAGSIAFSPDGKNLAIGGTSDGRVQIWDTNPLRLRHESRAHTDAIWGVAVSPDSRTLATSSWDGTVRLWHLRTGAELFALKGEATEQRLGLAFAPDCRQLISFGRRGGLAVWRTDTFGHETTPYATSSARQP